MPMPILPQDISLRVKWIYAQQPLNTGEYEVEVLSVSNMQLVNMIRIPHQISALCQYNRKLLHQVTHEIGIVTNVERILRDYLL